MADKVSKFIFPVKEGNTVTNKEFELPSGGSVTVDDALSDTSENPVQNKVVKSGLDGKSNTSHNHDERYYTEAEENAIIDALQSTIVDSIYPVGSLYMSINSTMPSFLTQGKTWELLSGDYVLKTISSGTGGQTSNAGNTGSTTLTAAQSGVPAHSHGLNSHTHTVGAHSHGLNSHTHSMQHDHEYQVRAHSYWGAMAGSDTNSVRVYNYYSGGLAGSSWAADVTTNVNNALQSGNTSRQMTQTASTGYTSGAVHGRTGVNTGAASGSTANSSAFNTGAASGSTANNTAADASQGHTHTAGMPQNIGVYVWKRTA